MLAKGARTNTHETDVSGLVYGMDGKLHPLPVTARFTSDKRGESLSIQVGELLVMMPFEKIGRMIDEARHRSI